jgi:hypothetical protein
LIKAHCHDGRCYLKTHLLIWSALLIYSWSHARVSFSVKRIPLRKHHSWDVLKYVFNQQLQF